MAMVLTWTPSEAEPEFEWLILGGRRSQEVLGFPSGSDGKESAGDVGLNPGSRRSPGGGHGNPLQSFCLENPWKEEPGGLQSMGLQSWT